MLTIKSRLLALAQELQALGIPESYYSVGHPRDDRTCLVFSKGKWLVFFSERGQLVDLREFDSFDGAKVNLIARFQ